VERIAFCAGRRFNSCACPSPITGTETALPLFFFETSAQMDNKLFYTFPPLSQQGSKRPSGNTHQR